MDQLSDYIDESCINEETMRIADQLKSDRQNLKIRYAAGKKVLSIDGSRWSFHCGDCGSCYVLTGLDDEGQQAVEQLPVNSFSTVEEAKIAANLLGYEAYESGIWLFAIE